MCCSVPWAWRMSRCLTQSKDECPGFLSHDSPLCLQKQRGGDQLPVPLPFDLFLSLNSVLPCVAVCLLAACPSLLCDVQCQRPSPGALLKASRPPQGPQCPTDLSHPTASVTQTVPVDWQLYCASLLTVPGLCHRLLQSTKNLIFYARSRIIVGLCACSHKALISAGWLREPSAGSVVANQGPGRAVPGARTWEARNTPFLAPVSQGPDPGI